LSLYKREHEEKITNYKGISLQCTAYKICVEVIRYRLEKEVEIKGMIPKNQAGFRRGRSTTDNIFILMYLM